MSQRQMWGAGRCASFAVALWLLALPSVPAQTRKHAGQRFSVTYTLSKVEDTQPYAGYLAILPGGLEFRGQRYEQERVRARLRGRAYSEKFTCAELSSLQFQPGFSTIAGAVRGRQRFIYCPHNFAALQAAITQTCKEQMK